MAKYLVQFSYTGEGLQGLLKEGGSKRKEATQQLIESLGGTVESYYFSFGDHDGIIIVDGLDNVSLHKRLQLFGHNQTCFVHGIFVKQIAAIWTLNLYTLNP